MIMNTEFMGLQIKNPLVVGSSTLTGSVESIKKLAYYGAGAVVLTSLFEEQIIAEADSLTKDSEMYSWYPDASDFIAGYTEDTNIQVYLDLIKAAKDAVDIPVFASINAISAGEWLKFAAEIEKAGADGLELNISILPEEYKDPRSDIEGKHLEIIDTVKDCIKIPIAVKVGSNYTNLLQFLIRLDHEGADGLTLFNRFYQPDIDIDTFKIVPGNIYSVPEEMGTPLRWAALLYGKVHCSIAASTGVYDGQSVVKHLLAGANAVQLCSALYKNGPQHIEVVLNELQTWMQKNSFDTIDDFRGTVAKQDSTTGAFERLQFMKKNAGQLL